MGIPSSAIRFILESHYFQRRYRKRFSKLYENIINFLLLSYLFKNVDEYI